MNVNSRRAGVALLGGEFTDFAKPKILVVDDVPANLVAIKTCLSHLDVEIFCANSGMEALSFVMKNDFALVLLDVQMPEMDGFETASLIRSNKETEGVPIIFATAFSTGEQHIFTGYGLGAVDYLFKPLDEGILQAKVKVFLDRYHDRKQREQAAAALRHYANALEQSNEDLEQLGYVVSHDLQEPLRKVTSFCQLLKESCGERLTDEEQSYIDFAVDGSLRMKNMILDLLELSRISTCPDANRKTCVEEALASALCNLEFAIADSNATVTHAPLPMVVAEPRQLTQLLQNLIGNGIKYRSPDRSPVIHLSVTRADDQWQFSVKDNGIGIPQEQFSRIFEIFKRLHGRGEYEGTGIGLAICKKIVNRFGGRIWLESEEGVGTTFYFTIAMDSKATSQAEGTFDSVQGVHVSACPPATVQNFWV